MLKQERTKVKTKKEKRQSKRHDVKESESK